MKMLKFHDTKYSWLRLTLTLFIGVFLNAGMWAVIAIMPMFEQELAISRSVSSAQFALNMFGFAIGNLFIGRMMDKLGVVKTVCFAAVISSISYFLCTYTVNIYFLSFLHLILGIGTACGFGPLITDISHWFIKNRAIAVSIVASGNYLAGVIWVPILNSISINYGWKLTYQIMSILVILVVIPISQLLRKKLPNKAFLVAENIVLENKKQSKISSHTILILLGIAGVGCCVAMSMPQVHLIQYCAELGYGPAIGAKMLSLMLFGGILSRLISGIIADKIGAVFTLFIGSTLQMLALFLYLPFDSVLSLFVVSLIFGLSQGGIVPSYAVIVREYLPSKKAGETIGLVMMMTILGMSLGGWLSGYIYQIFASYNLAFVNGIIWNFLNLFIIIYIIIKTGKNFNLKKLLNKFYY